MLPGLTSLSPTEESGLEVDGSTVPQRNHPLPAHLPNPEQPHPVPRVALLLVPEDGGQPTSLVLMVAKSVCQNVVQESLFSALLIAGVRPDHPRALLTQHQFSRIFQQKLQLCLSTHWPTSNFIAHNNFEISVQFKHNVTVEADNSFILKIFLSVVGTLPEFSGPH